MTLTFFSLAAALVAIVLLLVIPTLWRGGGRSPEGAIERGAVNAAVLRDQLAELDRDRNAGVLAQSDYDQARLELQRRVLEEAAPEAAKAATGAGKGAALMLAFALPVAGAALYLVLGNPAALAPQSHTQQQVSQKDIEGMVASLAAKLERNPEDTKGWAMLGRSYRALGRYAEAARAFEKAGEVVNQNPDLLTEYAEAAAMANNADLSGKPMELIERALKLDPQHPYALVLAGTAAFEAKNYAAAIDYWQRVLPQLPPGSEDARSISESIDKARAMQADKGKSDGKR